MVRILTRSLGSEVETPDLATLSTWVSERQTGKEADLITFKLESSLRPQILAGIDHPSAGGLFYAERVISSLKGITDRVVREEVYADPAEVRMDATTITGLYRGGWCTLPGLSELGLTDPNHCYRDDDEFVEALTGVYRELMRAMRDAGVGGHLVHCSRDLTEAEADGLAGGKTLLFIEHPDPAALRLLLEHQSVIAIPPADLPVLVDLMEEFTVRQVILIDPSSADLTRALGEMDADHLASGGYCNGGDCENYWKERVAQSTVPVQPQPS
jgi:hypothetical protein